MLLLKKKKELRNSFRVDFFLKGHFHFHSRCNKEARYFRCQPIPTSLTARMDGNTRTHLCTRATRTQAHEYMVTWQQHPRVQNRRNRNSNEIKMSRDRSGCKPRQERPVAELADGVLTIEVLPSGLLVPSDMQVPMTGTAAYEPGLA